MTPAGDHVDHIEIEQLYVLDTVLQHSGFFANNKRHWPEKSDTLVAGQCTICLSCCWTFDDPFHKRLPLEDILSQISPAHNFTDCWRNIIVALRWF